MFAVSTIKVCHHCGGARTMERRKCHLRSSDTDDDTIILGSRRTWHSAQGRYHDAVSGASRGSTRPARRACPSREPRRHQFPRPARRSRPSPRTEPTRRRGVDHRRSRPASPSSRRASRRTIGGGSAPVAERCRNPHPGPGRHHRPHRRRGPVDQRCAAALNISVRRLQEVAGAENVARMDRIWERRLQRAGEAGRSGQSRRAARARRISVRICQSGALLPPLHERFGQIPTEFRVRAGHRRVRAERYRRSPARRRSSAILR